MDAWVHYMIFVVFSFLEPFLQKTSMQHILNFGEVSLEQ